MSNMFSSVLPKKLGDFRALIIVFLGHVLDAMDTLILDFLTKMGILDKVNMQKDFSEKYYYFHDKDCFRCSFILYPVTLPLSINYNRCKKIFYTLVIHIIYN